jgi:hypothetical protein
MRNLQKRRRTCSAEIESQNPVKKYDMHRLQLEQMLTAAKTLKIKATILHHAGLAIASAVLGIFDSPHMVQPGPILPKDTEITGLLRSPK